MLVATRSEPPAPSPGVIGPGKKEALVVDGLMILDVGPRACESVIDPSMGLRL